MSIIASSIVLTGFGFSNLAFAQDFPPGSIVIPQEQIDKLCKPGDFNWALRNHFKGIRLTLQQRNRIRPAYENYRKELREYLKNNECTVIEPGVDPSFAKQVGEIFLEYTKEVNKILTKEQSPQWVKNVNTLWAPPIRY